MKRAHVLIKNCALGISLFAMLCGGCFAAGDDELFPIGVFHVDIRHGFSFAVVALNPAETAPSVELPIEVQQVIALLEDDDCPVAWLYAELAVSRHPSDASAYDARGRVEACYGQRKDATRDFAHALQLRPRYLRAYYDLRTLARDFGDDNAAFRFDERMTEIEPDDLNGYIAKGEAFSHLNQDATAYASFDVVRGRGTRTEQADAAYYTAELEDRRGDNAAAIIALNHAIEIEPDSIKAFCERSRVEELELFELDPYDVAIPLQPLYQQELRDTAETLKRRVALPCVLDHQSLADLVMHDTAAAAEHARAAIAARPRDIRGYDDLALAAAASRDRKLMETSLRSAEALGGTAGYPLVKRTEAHFAIADVPATLADVGELERLHYNQEYTQMLAGALLIAVDRFDAASKTLESAATESTTSQNHLLLLLAQAGHAARRLPHPRPRASIRRSFRLARQTGAPRGDRRLSRRNSAGR